MAESSKVAHCSEIGYEFLVKLGGAAPLHFSAIKPDGGIQSKCLWPHEKSDVVGWIEDKTLSSLNVYYSVNSPGWALDKKAEKSDIRTVRAFHVDIDPFLDETVESCKARAISNLAKFQPPPSVVIDSGNGVQALWILEEPMLLDGTADSWRKAEAYNIALARDLGGDACHNIDRIFRLPGTINFPNKKKIAKGRVPRPAKLLESSWRKYKLSEFTPAPDMHEARSTSARLGTVILSGNLVRYASTDDLPIKLLDYTVMLIVNGSDIDNPSQYSSRSEALWRVLCDMVRSGADDDTIASVILDPDFKISASVLDKPRPEAYAANQIARAREEVIDPALRELNEQHAVIESDRGGRCVVAEEDWDEIMQRWHIKYQSFDAFRNRYMHRSVKVGETKDGTPILAPLGKWWLQQEHRRQYKKIVFFPGQEVPSNHYNLWRGFGCDARPGDKHLEFMSHIRANLCGDNDALNEYVVKWMARMVQHPSKPGEVAIVVRGKKGTGKGFFGRTLRRLFGQHGLHISNAKHLIGNFNGHLKDCVFLFADEAFFANDKLSEGVLNALITEEMITVEAKGIDAEFSTNFLHIVIASNYDFVVPSSVGERRFVVLEASDLKMQDLHYFAKLQGDLDDGGYENLLYFLLNVDLQNFDHRRVVRTMALREQAISSLTALQRWLLVLLDEGRLPNNQDGRPNVATQSSLPNQVGMLEDANAREPANLRHSYKAIGDLLRKLGCVRSHLGECRGWIFPSLPEARQKFEELFGEQVWSDPHLRDWCPIDSRNRTPF